MEQVYGKDYVCSVGTFTTFQLKMALKDLGRYHGHPPQSMDYINKILDVDRGDSWKRLIENAMKYPPVKEFVLKNVELVNDIHLLHKQPRSASIHACATLILPKEDSNGEKRDIFTWIPVRKEGELLVSEWEGEPLADAGFLKEDILVIRQLDKFRSILNLIKQETGEDIDIYTIPLDDRKVYELFRKGWSEDVFHFGTNSLEQFSRELKPEKLSDLVAMIALIRPGGIQSNANVEYVQIKFGHKDPEYDYGLKEVTEETYGIYIYQEQIMKAVQVLGGFNPVEADGIRKAVGHLKKDLMLTFKDKFVKGAIERGCPVTEAGEIWDKLERFAGYGFNRSHSVAYAITGYICQWFKVHYPLQFWSVAFHFADEKDVPRYISEIHKMESDIVISPPDINNSQGKLYTDFQNRIIYWPLSKIKQVGEVGLSDIIAEREDKGPFKSLEDLYTRSKTNDRKINKQVIENLIFSGSFDVLEKIREPRDREKIFLQYYELAKTKPADQNSSFVTRIQANYWWVMKQREVSGLGYLDFVEVIKGSKLAKNIDRYLDSSEFTATDIQKRKKIVAGIVLKVTERGSTKTGKLASVLVENNFEQFYIMFWKKEWALYKDQVENSIGKLLIVFGEVDWDSYKNVNQLSSRFFTKIDILD